MILITLLLGFSVLIAALLLIVIRMLSDWLSEGTIALVAVVLALAFAIPAGALIAHIVM